MCQLYALWSERLKNNDYIDKVLAYLKPGKKAEHFSILIFKG